MSIRSCVVENAQRDNRAEIDSPYMNKNIYFNTLKIVLV